MPILGILSSSYYVPPSTFDYALISNQGIVFDSTDGTTWEHKKVFSVTTGNPNIAQTQFAFANNTFYAVGNNRFFSSTNGTDWSITSAAVASFNKVLYVDSKYYISSVGQIGTSTDFITWSYITLPATYSSGLFVAYGNNTFVAAGTFTFTSLSSTDGVTWTSRTFANAGIETEMIIRDLRYLNNLFVAVGSYRIASPLTTDVALIATSTDGITWTQRTAATGTTGSASLYVVAYGNSKYVAGHISNYGLEYSTDAITWSTGLGNDTNRTFYGLDYGSAAGFIAWAQNGDVWKSTDGISWNGTAIGGTGSSSSRNVVYNNGTYYLGGNYSSTNGTNIYTTTNGTSFTFVTSTYPKGGYKYSYLKKTNGYYFAFSTTNLDMNYSTDLVTWTEITPTATFGETGIRGIAYGNGTYAVFFGTNGTYSTSTDLVTWTTRPAFVGTNYQTAPAIYANNLFVGVLNNTARSVITSTDAVTWTSRTSNVTANVNDLAYVNNLFTINTSSGQISTSTDAITWTSRTSNVTTALYYTTYGNGVYVMGSSNGVVITSTDAVTWTSRATGVTAIVRTLYYDGSQFYGILQNSGYLGTQGYITSTDGTTWTSVVVNNKTTRTLFNPLFTDY